MLELIIGLIIFILIANIVFSFVPIPKGILGTLVVIAILFLLWRLVF